VRFVLVAGLVARRIVCRVVPGRQLAQGERVGIIRFGSRVDLDLPPGAIPAVGIGDRVVAGESVLARYAGRPA
jgi:phosphatidylserine decarboxylase